MKNNKQVKCVDCIHHHCNMECETNCQNCTIDCDLSTQCQFQSSCNGKCTSRNNKNKSKVFYCYEYRQCKYFKLDTELKDYFIDLLNTL